MRDRLSALEFGLDRAADQVRERSVVGAWSEAVDVERPQSEELEEILPADGPSLESPTNDVSEMVAPDHGSSDDAKVSGEPFVRFTAARYNLTMDRVGARRRSLASTILVLSAAVATVLVPLAASWHGPSPPIWIEALPLVWLIPVPFFLLAFRGTHRVLARHRFSVAGGA